MKRHTSLYILGFGFAAFFLVSLLILGFCILVAGPIETNSILAVAYPLFGHNPGGGTRILGGCRARNINIEASTLKEFIDHDDTIVRAQVSTFGEGSLLSVDVEEFDNLHHISDVGTDRVEVTVYYSEQSETIYRLDIVRKLSHRDRL